LKVLNLESRVSGVPKQNIFTQKQIAIDRTRSARVVLVVFIRRIISGRF